MSILVFASYSLTNLSFVWLAGIPKHIIRGTRVRLSTHELSFHIFIKLYIKYMFKILIFFLRVTEIIYVYFALIKNGTIFMIIRDILFFGNRCFYVMKIMYSIYIHITDLRLYFVAIYVSNVGYSEMDALNYSVSAVSFVRFNSPFAYTRCVLMIAFLLEYPIFYNKLFCYGVVALRLLKFCYFVSHYSLISDNVNLKIISLYSTHGRYSILIGVSICNYFQVNIIIIDNTLRRLLIHNV